MKLLSFLAFLFLIASAQINSSILRSDNSAERERELYLNQVEQRELMNAAENPVILASLDTPNDLSFEELVKGRNVERHLSLASKLGPPKYGSGMNDLIQHSMARGMEDLRHRQLITPSNHRSRRLEKIVKVPSNERGLSQYARMLRQKKVTKRKAKKAKSKSKSKRHRALQNAQPQSQSQPKQDIRTKSKGAFKKFMDNWWKPTRLGAIGLAGGLAFKAIRSYRQRGRLEKLRKLASSQREINLHTMKNEELLKQISEALKRSNHQVEYMRSLADERLSNKVDQLRVF